MPIPDFTSVKKKKGGEHKNEKPKTVKKDKCVDIEYKKIYLEIFDVIKLKF